MRDAHPVDVDREIRFAVVRDDGGVGVGEVLHDRQRSFVYMLEEIDFYLAQPVFAGS